MDFLRQLPEISVFSSILEMDFVVKQPYKTQVL